MEILIKCEGSRKVDINELSDFQGNLKELKEPEYNKLKKSIINYGFSFPVIVWKNNIIDGHQRIFTVKKMLNEGYNIGLIPVADIEADNIKEAKHKLLLFNSKYGKIEQDGLYEFIETSGLDFDTLKDEIELPDIDMDKINKEYYDDTQLEIVPEINFTQELLESHNYLILYFDNDIDWQTAVEKFKIETKTFAFREGLCYLW